MPAFAEWQDRVKGSTILQLRRWLVRRNLPVAGAKMQLVQAVLRATKDQPQTKDDYQLIPWHEQHAQAVCAARGKLAGGGCTSLTSGRTWA